MTEEALLSAIPADPADLLCWLALADLLEERGEPDRAELTRLDVAWRQAEPGSAERAGAEARVRELLAAGVTPCRPILTGPLAMRFALIPAGRFLMGSPDDEEGRDDDEGPRHEVEITRPFYLGVGPVTVGQFRAFARESSYRTEAERGDGALGWTGSNWQHAARYTWRTPGFAQADDHPVVCVSWNDAVALCEWLTIKFPERAYRLPTEAEWEYCCRGGAGESTPFHLGASLRSTQANFHGGHPYGGARRGPYRKGTVPAGSFAPNAWGLYQMHGNASEWCADRYEVGYYSRGPRRDPPGPSEGSIRVTRGGCWFSHGRFCRSAQRHENGPASRGSCLGFRLALVPSGG